MDINSDSQVYMNRQRPKNNQHNIEESQNTDISYRLSVSTDSNQDCDKPKRLMEQNRRSKNSPIQSTDPW